MKISSLLATVIQRYELGQISQLTPLGNAGGFSGAQFWKIHSDRGELCVRRWPQETRINLLEIHRVLQLAHTASVPVALPIACKNGKTLVYDPMRYAWEVSPWMPGIGDFNENPSNERLDQATYHLSMFHRNTRTQELHAPSQSLQERYQQLLAAPRKIEAVQSNLHQSPTSLRQLARDLIPLIQQNVIQIQPQLENYSQMRWLLGPVIRDIHHDHLLFQDKQLSGIVDFGSMRIDTRCLDIARMIGSLKIDHSTPWEHGLSNYMAHEPLNTLEQELIETLHRCNLTLGSLNWLNWILVEERQFEDWSAIEKRLAGFADQLADQKT